MGLRAHLRDLAWVITCGMVRLRPGDVLVRIADLEGAGLHDIGGQRDIAAGEFYVSLASLAPAITYVLDEQALALRLTVLPTLLSPTVLDLQPSRPLGILDSQEASAFVNYALNWRDMQHLEGFGEAGVSLGGDLLFSSFALNPEGSFVRGFTNVTFDERDHLRRWVLGDDVAITDALGGGAVFGGISVSREFRLDPYMIRSPTLRFSGAVLSPSTLDIYVNDIRVRREQVPPGPFDLRNLLGFPGRGSMSVVIRDSFGREEEIALPYYLSTGLLAPGLSEYRYQMGLRRDHLATASWAYGPPAFLGRHRLGLTDALTAGLRLEATPALMSGGPTVTAGLPVGEVELSGAASHADGRIGLAASLAYTYFGRLAGFGAFARMLSPHYATVSLTPADDRPRLETSTSISVPLGSRLSLTLQYAALEDRKRGWFEHLSLLSSMRVTERINLFAFGQHALGRASPSDNGLFAGLSYAFGQRTTGAIFQQQYGGKSTTTIELHRSLPVGTGLGYRVQGGMGAQGPTTALLQYQGPYGRYEAAYEHAHGTDATTLSAAGGLVAIGGRLYPTRPVQDSFALIRVPGVAGVRGYVSNQEVGRTNTRGDLVVPNLLAYYGNRLSLADVDLPLSYSIEDPEQLVAPPFRGGAVVRFRVQRLQRLTGMLVVEVAGQTVIPAYGQLTVTGGDKPASSPLSKQGEFYLENLAPGLYTAEVVYRGGTCTWAFTVPVSDQPSVNLGTLRCPMP